MDVVRLHKLARIAVDGATLIRDAGDKWVGGLHENSIHPHLPRTRIGFYCTFVSLALMMIHHCIPKLDFELLPPGNNFLCLG